MNRIAEILITINLDPIVMSNADRPCQISPSPGLEHIGSGHRLKCKTVINNN